MNPKNLGRGFEVNTDPVLVDPDWDIFASEHDRRYGLAISFFKSGLRGACYDNQVKNLRVGRQGFYAQSKRFPAAFFGDTIQPTETFMSNDEAERIAWEAAALYRSEEAQSLTCLYGVVDLFNGFFGYRIQEGRRYEIGSIRSALPLHMRVMVSAGKSFQELGPNLGVLIYQRMENEDHLLLQAPGRRQPFLGQGADIN